MGQTASQSNGKTVTELVEVTRIEPFSFLTSNGSGMAGPVVVHIPLCCVLTKLQVQFLDLMRNCKICECMIPRI